MNRFTPYKFAFFIMFFVFFGVSSGDANDEGYKITGHYFEKQDSPRSDYKDTIQWNVANPNEWHLFIKKMIGLPKKPLVDPMKAGVDDLIYFDHINPDKLSGNKIYLSSLGIVQVARMPVDFYHVRNERLYEFLESERKRRVEYGDESSVIKNIKEPGIVIIYRGSRVLQNPGWVVNDPEEVRTYVEFFNSLQKVSNSQVMRWELEKTAYDEEGSYIMYLNYEKPYADIITLDKDGGIRASNIKTVFNAYDDTAKFYDIFKLHAINIKRNKEISEDTIRRQREASQF